MNTHETFSVLEEKLLPVTRADSVLRACVEERDDIVTTFNDYLGHQSLIKTNKFIKERFGWRKGRREIYNLVVS